MASEGKVGHDNAHKITELVVAIEEEVGDTNPSDGGLDTLNPPDLEGDVVVEEEEQPKKRPAEPTNNGTKEDPETKKIRVERAPPPLQEPPKFFPPHILPNAGFPPFPPHPFMMMMPQLPPGLMPFYPPINTPHLPFGFPYDPRGMLPVTNPGLRLAMPMDQENLSDYQTLIRHQLEIFEASPTDVESNTQGRKKPVLLGQVGLRCRHCSMLPLRGRGRGAVYYPTRLEGIYQAAQNMSGSHLLSSCPNIPVPIREELNRLRQRKDNASGGKRYWADGARALGIFETETGLRLRPKLPPAPPEPPVVETEKPEALPVATTDKAAMEASGRMEASV